MAMTLQQLRERVRGEIVAPGDDSYDEARAVHNGMSDRRPAAVIRVANAGDVMATVAYARENDLDLAIRGGGHSAPGFGTVDDGVVIDFSRMRTVRVDPVRMTARAEQRREPVHVRGVLPAAAAAAGAVGARRAVHRQPGEQSVDQQPLGRWPEDARGALRRSFETHLLK